MSNSVYKINKGINKPIEFKGLKAQYIWYLAIGIGVLLLGFAVLYMIGVNSYINIGVIALAGTGIFFWVYRLSNTYGEHGMKKQMARRSIPRIVKCYTRNGFITYHRKEILK
jgi:lipopolysaccharide export LptBFGC system permease protein LptF